MSDKDGYALNINRYEFWFKNEKDCKLVVDSIVEILCLALRNKEELKCHVNTQTRWRTSAIKPLDLIGKRFGRLAKQVQTKRLEAERRISEGLPANGSFEDIAREWASVPTDRLSDKQTEKIIGWMEKDIFPWLGKRPINEITTPEIDATIQRIVDRGALDIARRILWNCGRIFGYAAKCHEV